MTKHHPTPEERDERVGVPREPAGLIEGVLAVEPDDESFWAVRTTDGERRFLGEQGTWVLVKAKRFGSKEEAEAADRPDARPWRATRVTPF